MYVCVCNAVTEKQVLQAIDNGAVTVALLKEELNVATRCGACGDCLEACLSQVCVARKAAADASAGCVAA